jgi:hypothetical protein
MGKLFDFLILLALGVMATLVLAGTVAGTAHVVGPTRPEIAGLGVPLVAGAAGFVLGVAWRLILWDLPTLGMAWLRDSRRHAGSLALLLIGAAVLVLV